MSTLPDESHDYDPYCVRLATLLNCTYDELYTKLCNRNDRSLDKYRDMRQVVKAYMLLEAQLCPSS